MSMNLIFKHKPSKNLVEFPYQTSTKLSYTVLKEPSRVKRFLLIITDLQNTCDEKEIDMFWNRVQEIGMYLFDENYELEII